jgi:hypothetical protein
MDIQKIRTCLKKVLEQTDKISLRFDGKHRDIIVPSFMKDDEVVVISLGKSKKCEYFDGYFTASISFRGNEEICKFPYESLDKSSENDLLNMCKITDNIPKNTQYNTTSLDDYLIDAKKNNPSILTIDEIMNESREDLMKRAKNVVDNYERIRMDEGKIKDTLEYFYNEEGGFRINLNTKCEGLDVPLKYKLRKNLEISITPLTPWMIATTKFYEKHIETPLVFEEIVFKCIIPYECIDKENVYPSSATTKQKIECKAGVKLWNDSSVMEETTKNGFVSITESKEGEFYYLFAYVPGLTEGQLYTNGTFSVIKNMFLKL